MARKLVTSKPRKAKSPGSVRLNGKSGGGAVKAVRAPKSIVYKVRRAPGFRKGKIV